MYVQHKICADSSSLNDQLKFDNFVSRSDIRMLRASLTGHLLDAELFEGRFRSRSIFFFGKTKSLFLLKSVKDRCIKFSVTLCTLGAL